MVQNENMRHCCNDCKHCHASNLTEEPVYHYCCLPAPFRPADQDCPFWKARDVQKTEMEQMEG